MQYETDGSHKRRAQEGRTAPGRATAWETGMRMNGQVEVEVSRAASGFPKAVKTICCYASSR
jgi:hypothetical protein